MQCCGGGLFLGPERVQSKTYDLKTVFNQMQGVYQNSASDSIFISLESGSNVLESYVASTAATPRLMGCELWLPSTDGAHAVHIYRCLGSQIISSEINGTVRVTGDTFTSPNEMRYNQFISCNFFLADVGAEPTAYVDADYVRGVTLTDCKFKPADTWVPDYLVQTTGTCNVVIDGTTLPTVGNVQFPYDIEITDNPQYVQVRLANFEDKYFDQTETRIAGGNQIPLSVDRLDSNGKAATFKRDGVDVGSIDVVNDVLQVGGAKVTVQVAGPYADDATAAAAGITTGHSYHKADGSVVVNIT